MYPVSQDFINAVVNGNQTVLNLVFEDGSSISTDDLYFEAGGAEFSYSMCSTDDLTIGTCESARFTCTLLNVRGELSQKVYGETNITMSVLANDGQVIGSVPMGTFYINTPTKPDGDIVELEGYDRMASLGISASDFIQDTVFPCTINDMLKRIVDRFGLAVEEGIYDIDFTMTEDVHKFPTNVTFRDLIGWIAARKFKCARFSRENKLQFYWLGAVVERHDTTVEDNRIMVNSFSNGDYQTQPITRALVKTTSGLAFHYPDNGTDDNVFTVYGNPFFDWTDEALYNFARTIPTYYPMALTVFDANPAIEPGDRVYVKKTNPVLVSPFDDDIPDDEVIETTIPLMHITYKWQGGIMADYEATGNDVRDEDENAAYEVEVSQTPRGVIEKLIITGIDADEIDVRNIRASSVKVNSTTTLDDKLLELSDRIDGRVDTYKAPHDPLPTQTNRSLNYPAWTYCRNIPVNNTVQISNTLKFVYTEDDFARHAGDIFYNSATGVAYRFSVENNVWYWDAIDNTELGAVISRVSRLENDNEKFVSEISSLTLGLEETKTSISQNDERISLVAERTGGIEDTVKKQSASITINSQSITSAVTSIKTVDGRVTTAETKIQQNAEAIALINGTDSKGSRLDILEDGIKSTVKEGSIISSINQSKEAVTINASKINLSGYVTVTSFNSSIGALKTLPKSSSTVYYRKTTTGTPNAPTASTTISNSNVSNAWTYVVPSFVKGCHYFSCQRNVDSDSKVTYGSIVALTDMDLVAGWSRTNSSGTTLIDGGQIYANSVTADKINVTNLSAFNADIGGWEINDDGIYKSGKAADGSTYNIVIRGTHGTDKDFNVLSFYNGETKFSVSNKGVLTAKDADIKGKITASSGTLDNVTINSTCTIGGGVTASSFSATEGAKFIKAVTTIYYRTTKTGTPDFPASASDITSGSVTDKWTYSIPNALSGGYKFWQCEMKVDIKDKATFANRKQLTNIDLVASWTHGSDRTMIDGGNIYAKSITAGQISVDNLYSISAKISGWDIDKDGIKKESKTADGTTYSTYMHAYDNPSTEYHAFGVKKGGLAQFYVTNLGKLYALNAEIKGDITANKGTLDNVTINSSCTIKGTLNASQINAGTLSFDRLGTIPGSKIADGAITNGKVNAGSVFNLTNVNLALGKAVDADSIAKIGNTSFYGASRLGGGFLTHYVNNGAYMQCWGNPRNVFLDPVGVPSRRGDYAFLIFYANEGAFTGRYFGLTASHGFVPVYLS